MEILAESYALRVEQWHASTETTENICCEKVEIAVDHCKVTMVV